LGAWVLYGTRAAGIVLTLRAAAILDIWELAGTRPARHAPGEHGGSATFTRRGPYGWVRHPIYAGWFLVVFSVPAMTMTQLVFAVVSSVYLVVGMVFEERSLLAAAPGAYGEYQREVRWKVIPGVY
jgi:protein-S-isoprenylcysteine O-methyltransferase Ste14